MKKAVTAVLILSLSGCAVGPRRLQKDCTWSGREQTTTEKVLIAESAVAIAGGFLVFVYGFATSNNTLAGAAGTAMLVSIPLGWWAQGAFEEVPVPGSRFDKCRREVWRAR